MRLIKYLFTRTTVLAALVCLVCPTVEAQDVIPDTPAGQCFSKLLQVVNDEDENTRSEFWKDGFAENDDATVARRQQQTDQLRSQLGKLTFLKTLSSQDHQLTAECKTSNGPNVQMTIAVTDEDTPKIKSIALELGGSDEPVDESPLDSTERNEVIERLAKELRAKYVFPEVGEKMAATVENSLGEGEYAEIKNVREFASTLTEQLRDICNDKHLRIRAGSLRRPGRTPGRRPVDNHGFVKAEMLPGGVGYLKFNYFSGDEAARETATAAMNFLGHSKALIFDLRQNGGGSPEMIAWLSSYLFDERVHLNSFYNRPTDTTTETWTETDVPGRKFSEDTPVFVLTSSRTFSGAEEFSYNLKNMKRGTIVGETTGGGAHPVMPVTLGERLNITMPFARAINPITKTNWEGVGVEPDVAVPADEALDKALELARAQISDMAERKADTKTTSVSKSDDVSELLQKADELMADESFSEAAVMFAKVTRLEPENEMAWFRYGYCLHASGALDKAIEVHQKAAQFDRFAGIATYNLACAYSLKNKADEAFAALETAIDLGFDDVSQLKGDSDFDNIRDDERFASILRQLKGD